MLVEVCANSLESALIAERAGADRIELCSELAVGGLTPSYGLLQAVKEQLSIPVHVLIRPRSGDFSFTENEFKIMLMDIALCQDMGFEGIVAGVLLKDFTLDVERMGRLKSVSGNMKFTFHRAFDWVVNPEETMKQLENLQVDYILSSGQQKSAEEGIELLTDLHTKTTTIKMMPGAGIKGDNVGLFLERGFNAVHLSGAAMVETLSNKPSISMNSVSFLSDDHIAVTQMEHVAAVLSKVK
jgi:copper homeostasis protein